MGKKSAGKVRVKQVGGSGAAVPPSLDDLLNPEDLMKDLPPPKQDPNTSMIWPLSQTFSLKYKHFSVLYPAYIDRRRSIQKGGRRISKLNAVEDPTMEEMSLILQSMNVRHVLQPFKCYPRDVGYILHDNSEDIISDDEVMTTDDAQHEIVYPLKARGRILVDMDQAEERWNYLRLQQKLLQYDDMDIPDVQVNEVGEINKGCTKFSKHALLEEISKQISRIPLREERLQEVKRRNKKLASLAATEGQKKKQSQGKKKKK